MFGVLMVGLHKLRNIKSPSSQSTSGRTVGTENEGESESAVRVWMFWSLHFSRKETPRRTDQLFRFLKLWPDLRVEV